MERPARRTVITVESEAKPDQAVNHPAPPKPVKRVDPNQKVRDANKFIPWKAFNRVPGRVIQPIKFWTSCVYVLLDPRSQHITYVGVSSSIPTSYSRRLINAQNTKALEWAHGLHRKRLTPEVRIITYAPPWRENTVALQWINWIKARGCLLNSNSEITNYAGGKDIANMYQRQLNAEARNTST